MILERLILPDRISGIGYIIAGKSFDPAWFYDQKIFYYVAARLYPRTQAITAPPIAPITILTTTSITTPVRL